MNGVSVCLEEIALEGLDGITIPTLWNRLSCSSHTICSTLDNSYKEFLWRSVVNSRDVQTFLLTEPRKEFDFTDDGTTYPYCCINDCGVRGSCSTFNTRKLITVTHLSFAAAENMYGSRLVLVASQLVRNKVLFGDEFDPTVEVTDVMYCVLEKIGRGRTLGRLQSVLSSLMSIDNRTMFYHVKVLQGLQLITKQPVMLKKDSPNFLVTTMLYLSRYHVEHGRDSIKYKISQSLTKAENQCLSLSNLCSDIREPKEAIVKSVHELSKSKHVEYLKMDINGQKLTGSPTVGTDKVESFDREKVVIHLAYPFYNMSTEEDNEIDDDEEWSLPENSELLMKIPAEVPIMHIIYAYVESKGKEGTSVVECCQELSMQYFQVRQVLSDLEAQQKVSCIFTDKGKARINRYISRKALPGNHAKLPVLHDQSVVLNNQRTLLEETEDQNTASLNTFSNNCDNEENTIATSRPINPRILKHINTEKFQRRRSIALDFFNSVKVIEGDLLLRKIIIEKEKEMGIHGVVDKKVVLFLLKKLEEAGSVQRIKLNIEVEKKSHDVTFYCTPGITKESNEVLSLVKRFKDDVKVKNAKRAGFLHCEKLAAKAKNSHPFLPKMQRCQMLHTFLFYLIYELCNPDSDYDGWQWKYAWAEQLKPEHSPGNKSKGWFTPSSILLLLPVSLYCKLVGGTFENIDDGPSQHTLLKDLPPIERYSLIGNHQVHCMLMASFEILTMLGLISPTSKHSFAHSKDITCYLSTSAIIKDTRNCVPAYHEAKHPDGQEFPKTSFSFSTLADVEEYWSEVRTICTSTPLNRRRFGGGLKPREKAGLRAHVVDERDINTSGKPLGDGLGAGGFDSRLFCHLKKHWTWPLVERTVRNKPESDVEDSFEWQLCFTTGENLNKAIEEAAERKKLKRTRCESSQKEITKKKKLNPQENAKTGKDACLSVGKLLPSDRSKKTPGQETKKKQRRKRKKKIRKAQRKQRLNLFTDIRDQRDQDAIRRREEKRSTFTPQQHKLLFICSLALRILGKKSTKSGYSDWLWTRDVLYEDDYESAKTKTALSISRKYRSMTKNVQTKINLDICAADCMGNEEFLPYCNLGKRCTDVMFNELVDLLKKKYSMENMVTIPHSLPRTLRDFQLQKNLQNSIQPSKPDRSDSDILSLEARETSIADIRQKIIRDSVVSALFLENENYDPNKAFAFFSQFSQDELISAVSVLKNGRTIVRNALRHSTGDDVARCTFSQTLSSVGRRNVEGHFPSSLMDDLNSFYQRLQCPRSAADGGSKSPKHSVVVSCYDNSVLGGINFCIFSLLTCKRLAVSLAVPEKLLALELAKKPQAVEVEPKNLDEESFSVEVDAEFNSTDLRITENDAECDTSVSERSRLTETSKSSMTLTGEKDPKLQTRRYEQNSSRNLAGKKRQPEKNALGQATAIEINNQTTNHHTTVPANNNSSGLNLSRRATGSCHGKKSNEMVLDVLSGIEDHLFGSLAPESHVSLYKANLQLTPSFACTITIADDRCISTDGENRFVNSIEQITPSVDDTYDSYLENIILYRNTGDRNRIQFSVNPCSLEVSLLPSPKQTLKQEQSDNLAHSVALHLKSKGVRMPDNVDECLDVCSNMFGYTVEDCQALEAVYETIESSKELGMSCASVEALAKSRNVLGKFSCRGLIKVLQAFNLVCQVGFLEAVFVAKTFEKAWLVPFPFGKVDRPAPASQTADSEQKSVDVSSGDVRNCATQTGVSNQVSRPWINVDGQVNKNAYNTLHRSVLGYIIRYPGVQKHALVKNFVNLIFPVALDDILVKLIECNCIEHHISYLKKITLFSSRKDVGHGSKTTYYLPRPDAMFKLIENILV